MSREVTFRTLQGHAHWVNTLALSTDYVLRTEAVVNSEDNIDPNDSKLYNISVIYLCTLISFRLIDVNFVFSWSQSC